MRDSWILAILSALALLFMAALAWKTRDRSFTGHNDFVQLYTGARLVGTSHLYDSERVRQVQLERVGVTGPAWRYTRLPYYGVLLWPLGRLPYRAAYLVWQAAALGALVAFVLIWQPASAPLPIGVKALFTSLSLPVFAGLMNGQDVTFLLLWLALAVRSNDAGRPFQAGLLLSLCAAKFHLFVLLPALILGQRNWRLAGGLAAGGSALGVLSFAAGGLDWPLQYYRVLTDPGVHPSAGNMPNIHGMLSILDLPRDLEWPLAAATALAVWLVARRASFPVALAATLAGGLLVSYHAYLPDSSLLLPAGLTVVSSTRSLLVRVLALWLLIPVGYFLLLGSTPAAAAAPVSLLLLIAAMALETRR